MGDENNNPTEGGNKLTEEQIKLNEKLAERLIEKERLQSQIEHLQQKNNKGTGEEIKLLEAKLALQEAIIAGDQDQIRVQTASIATIEQRIQGQKELNETLAAATALGESFGKSIFELDSVFLKAIGSAGGLKEAYNAFAEGVEKAAEESSVLLVGLDSTVTGFKRLFGGTLAAVKALDLAGAEFVQATGASRDFARAAFETRDSLGLMGISGQDAVKTMGRLYSGFSEFSELSRGSQQDFTVLSAQIEKLGGDAAGMAQTFTKVAGMSLTETETAMREVAGAADALGIPLERISNDLVGMGELFAKMGSGAMDVFLELQAASKATGLSVQSLYDIVGQYDTFEAANQAASRLNMVLGGNLLDTYSLLNATEDERIELLQRAMEQSSLTFDEMDRWQKMEVSAALGISLEEAAQLFGTTRGEVEKTAAELMHAGMTQEELEQRTRDASTAMDKFNVLMGNLAIAVGPIVEGINDIIDVLIDMTEGWTATGFAVAIAIGGIALALLKAGAVGLLFGVRMRIAAKVAGSAGRSMAGGIRSVGKVSQRYALGILALGAAIGAAAYGFSFLAEQLKEMTPGKIAATAGAILAVGVSVGILALALSSMGNPLAAAGLGVLTGALIVLSVAGFALSAAGLAAAGAIGRIANKINNIDTTKISSLAAALSSIVQIASMSLTGTGIPRFIREVGEALNELPDNTEKTVAFKATADSLANLMQIGSSVEAEQLERIKMIIDAVSNAEGAESTNRLADAINSLVRGQANNQGTTNTIELDGRVLARWIDRHDATRFRAAIGD